jgi:group II intron reverse transcriptase/maturase
VKPGELEEWSNESDKATKTGKKAMYEELMEEAVSSENVGCALKAVQRNRGAAGIDRMETSQLEDHLKRHWEKIRAKLLNGTYAVTPVRQVEIPKPGGGERKLGIPTVLDRFIQQLLLQVLTPIFESKFSDHSYGFRPGRSAHDAVRQAREYVISGKDWVVDIDIEKFFDRVHHDILMRRIGQTIRDKRVLKLIGRYLRSGIMAEGVVMQQTEGTPQGGPLSPLLANIYLDPLDQELEKRGHCFVRYADDSNVYVGGPASAARLIQTLPKWIEKNLRLKVNVRKSGTGRPWERKFLGFRITADGQIEVSPESLKRFKVRVRQLWDGQQNGTSRQLRDHWLRFVRGWWNYYKLAEWRRPVFDLEGWIRRHIRKCFWIRWHNSKGRWNALKRLGIRGRLLRIALSSRGAWRMARNGALQRALNNRVLLSYGFLLPSDLAGLNA